MHARTTLPTKIPRQDRHGWSRWHMTWSVAIVAALGLALISSPLVQAKTFHCGAGDVQCVIAAMNEANASGKTNEIRLEAGTYTLDNAIDWSISGPSGLPSITSTLTIQGVGADLTIIERDVHAALFRLIRVAATGFLTLENLTVRYGDLDLFSGLSGGGIRNDGALTVSYSLITNNSAADGGGIYNRGTLMITQSVLTGNSVGGQNGRGGGALCNENGTVTVKNSTLADNTTRHGIGAGLSNLHGTVTVENSTFADNFGQHGSGGLGNHNGILTIVNSTLADNTADSGVGGGLSNAGNGIVTITNSTVIGNHAGGGGGLSNQSGTVVLRNTILALNTIDNSGFDGPDCSGLVTSQGTNLVGNPGGCTITLQGTDLTEDPGVGLYTDDGTPGNGHFPLLPTSQVINAGNEEVCPKRDQLGEQRHKPCDIGAIEFQGKVMSSQ